MSELFENGDDRDASGVPGDFIDCSMKALQCSGWSARAIGS